MLSCGIAIGLTIFGLLGLIRGKMTISKTKVVVGVPARLLGLLAMTPIPLLLGVGVVIGLMNLGEDPQKLQKDNQLLFAAIEVGIVVGVAVLVFVIAAVVAIHPREAERRERAGRYEDEYDDEHEDARDRRDRDRDDYDDRDDRRDRRRADRDDRDDDYDDRDDRKPKPWQR